jgi:hypothetical protein
LQALDDMCRILTLGSLQQFACCECPPGSKAVLMFQDKQQKKHWVSLPPADKTKAKEAIMDAFETVEVRLCRLILEIDSFQ